MNTFTPPHQDLTAIAHSAELYSTTTRSSVAPAPSYTANDGWDSSGADPCAPIIRRAGELLAMPMPTIPKLLDPIFPRKGLATLVGKADCGKSMLGRQLAISVAAGLETCVGLPLGATHQSAIYISTEDSEEDTNLVVAKQCTILTEEQAAKVEKHLRFMFKAAATPRRMREELDRMLSSEPADLVVVDGYADMFEGKDSNSMTDVRQMLEVYSQLAHKHNCLVLFLSHVNKAGNNQTPDQTYVIGSSAFTQKVRTVVELRRDGDSAKRKLTVTKGNAVSDDFKSNTHVLEFDSETLTYKHTGTVVARSSAAEAKIDFAQLFNGHEELAAGDLIKMIHDKYRLGETRARHYMSESLVNSGRAGYWRLKPNTEDLDTSTLPF